MNIIKRIFQKIVKITKNFKLAIRSISKVYRYGGYTKVKIAQIQRGEVLNGKRILITGASSGIGLAIARRCIDEGAHVVITGRSPQKLNDALEFLGSPKAKSIVWDVADVKLHESKLSETYSILGGTLDMLVNNAGILQGGDFPNVKESVWDEVYQINSKGLFFITQTVCSKWMDLKTIEIKKVLNISSQGGFVGATYPYRMTKWDVAGLTQGLGVKLASHGILVNGIAPGVIATKMQKECMEQGDNVYYPHNPIERFALPEEIAELAIFMLSDAANFFAGQTIVCDGGFSVK